MSAALNSRKFNMAGVSNTSCSACLLRCLILTLFLFRWDVSQVTNFAYMFNVASAFNQDLCVWKDSVQSSANLENMFGNTASCPDPEWTPVAAEGPYCNCCYPCCYISNCFPDRLRLKTAVDNCYTDNDYSTQYGPIATWFVTYCIPLHPSAACCLLLW